MSPLISLPGLRRSVVAVCFALIGLGQVHSLPAATPVKVAFLFPGEDKALVAPLQEAGGQVVPSEALLADGTGVLIFSPGPGNIPAHAETIHAEVEKFLKNGGTLIVDLNSNNPLIEKIESFLPVNIWTLQSERLARASTSAIAPPGSAFKGCLQTTGFELPTRYDLHLPYSTLESGQQRYEAARLGKELLNTDWRVSLTTDRDGRLPLLVEGRYGPGKVFVFAGSLAAHPLQEWRGYKNFLATLLTAAAPQPVGPTSDAAQLRLELPVAQPSGPLRLLIHNPTNRQIPAVLACKVRNAIGGLMNSYSQPVTLAPGASLEVPLVETSSELQTAVMARASDTAVSFRRVEAGLSAPDRKEIVVSVNCLVDRTPAVTLEVRGEDVRAFPKTEDWPAGGIEMSGINSLPIQRFVYFCGDKPKATIHVANALHDIAPLAKAVDAGWPENPSAPGLNDFAYSYESVRGKFPLTGYWSGRKGQPKQQLRLDWTVPVTLAAQRLVAQGDYRRRDTTNPADYTLTATRANRQTVPLAEVHGAAYTFAQRADRFAPVAATGCALTISGFDPKAANEPRAFSGIPGTEGIDTDCAIDEWVIEGWPGINLPPAVKGNLQVSLHDLSDGSTTVLSDKQVTLDPCSAQDIEVEFPARANFGEVRVTAEFAPAGGSPVQASLPVLFVPRGRDHLISRDTLGSAETSLLCSPGFSALNSFGTGTDADTQGWGGPDDKVWAWTHGLMEIGTRAVEQADRFFVSPVRLSHYTDPWRDFPSGRYVWGWATDNLLNEFKTGKWKGKASLHIVYSDRWNGIPIGAGFGWSDLIGFDQWLRGQGKPGLQGRTRVQLTHEITEHHADDFQRFEFSLYTNEQKKSQDRLAEAGVRFTSETHGSFPLIGGKLGELTGQTDKAVGTDLFWELRDEDLYKALGYRFGLVAANPDLESGSYAQWGWISATQANPTWYATSGDAEPSRRQWYSTYWQGRVTSEGAFKPYTVYGFSTQGASGVKNVLDDWQRYNRVQSTMIWVRPERPTGCGIVASWPLQESRMSPEASTLGFGLYAGKNYSQIDTLVGELYQRLERNGVPISFVASTDTLRKWRGTQPLIVADGFETTPAEIADMARMNQAGAPIIAVGSQGRSGRTPAETFFGVIYNGTGWTAGAGTLVVNDAHGAPFAFVNRRHGAPTLFCPLAIQSLDGAQSELLAGLVLDLIGKPLAVAPGVATTTFSSNGSLFLVLGSQSDASQVIPVAVKPALLDPAAQAAEFRVVDVDEARVLTSQVRDGVLHFDVPCGPNDGRMIQIIPVSSRTAAVHAPVAPVAQAAPVTAGRR